MPSTSISTPSDTRAMPKLRGAAADRVAPGSFNAFENTWKIVKPKPISDSDVRSTDISVRSALMRVRWKLMPVRRDDSSTDLSSAVGNSGSGGRGATMPAASSRSPAARKRESTRAALSISTGPRPSEHHAQDPADHFAEGKLDQGQRQ